MAIGVFVHIRNAFCHQTLFKKLWFNGNRRVTYQWIRSNCSNIAQYMLSYEGHTSEIVTVMCGFPQASRLYLRSVALLFTKYVNDMCNVSKLLKLVWIADGTFITSYVTEEHMLADSAVSNPPVCSKRFYTLSMWMSITSKLPKRPKAKVFLNPGISPSQTYYFNAVSQDYPQVNLNVTC